MTDMAKTRAELHRQVAEMVADGLPCKEISQLGCLYKGPYQVDSEGNLLLGRPEDGEPVGPALFKLVAYHPYPGPGLWMEGVNTEYSPCVSERALGRTFHHDRACSCMSEDA